MSRLLPRTSYQMVNSLIFGAINFPLILASAIILSIISPSLFSLLERFHQQFISYFFVENVNNNSYLKSITWSLLCWAFELVAAACLLALLFIRRRRTGKNMKQSAGSSFSSMLSMMGIGYCCQVNPSRVFTSLKSKQKTMIEKERRKMMEKARREIFGDTSTNDSKIVNVARKQQNQFDDNDGDVDDDNSIGEHSENEKPSFAAFLLWQLLFSVSVAASILLFEIDSGFGEKNSASSRQDEYDDDYYSHHHDERRNLHDAVKVAEILRPVFFVAYSLFWIVLLGFWSGFDEEGGDVVTTRRKNEDADFLKLD